MRVVNMRHSDRGACYLVQAVLPPDNSDVRTVPQPRSTTKRPPKPWWAVSICMSVTYIVTLAVAGAAAL